MDAATPVECDTEAEVVARALVEVPGFAIGALLGRGAAGDVWSARRASDGLDVALKVLRSTADDEIRARFVREARVASALTSEHTARVIDARLDGEGPLFIAYERLEGETLEARLDREGDLSLEEILPIADGVLDALGAAHARAIIHRDVKPANVFLERGEAGSRALLIDFGVAKAPGDDAGMPLRTTGGSTLGSLAYMAPEQAGGASTVDARADLYGLGAVMFRALAGRPPFVAGSAATMLALKLERDPPKLSDVTGVAWPSSIEKLLFELLARDPAQRLASAALARERIDAVAKKLRVALASPRADEEGGA